MRELDDDGDRAAESVQAPTERESTLTPEVGGERSRVIEPATNRTVSPAPTVLEKPVVPSTSADDRERPERATARKAPPTSKTATRKPELTVDGILHEKELLEAALVALEGGDPRKALELLDQAAREVKAGVLGSERRKLRIRALCASGRVAQARGEAEVWRASEPESPHAKAAVQLCPR